MADVFEQNLPSKANLTTNDYIRVVGSDNNSYKQLVSDVAKKIIENYTGSSLAGSSQSVKSALDTLNSKIRSGFYTSYAALSDSNRLNINFSDSSGVFLLICMDRRAGANPKACLFQKYQDTTNKYVLTGGSNWASTSISTGMQVTVENTYFTIIAIGNVPFTMTPVS